MIKDLNGKVIQFYRVIRGLNEVIMSKELEQINDYYEAKFKIDEWVIFLVFFAWLYLLANIFVLELSLRI